MFVYAHKAYSVLPWLRRPYLLNHYHRSITRFHRQSGRRRILSSIRPPFWSWKHLKNTAMPPRKRSAATAAADSSGVEENTQESSKKNPTAETQTETKKQKTTGKSKATTGPRVPEGVQEGYHQPYEVSEAKKKGLFTEKNGCFRVVSWNVNGLRALLKRGELLKEYVEAEDPDVLCLAETKVGDQDIPKLGKVLPGYYDYWNTSQLKKGYSGIACFSKIKPINVIKGFGIEKHDMEGRHATLEFDDCYVVTAYVPNSGMKLERLNYRTSEWDAAFRDHLTELKKKKPVILAGDLNVAPLDMDIHDPVSNKNKSPGFCDSERDNFNTLLDAGFSDVYREFNPNQQQFTFWGQRFKLREKNKGWKLDHTLVSNGIKDRVRDSFIRWFMTGSDHVPVGIDVEL